MHREPAQRVNEARRALTRRHFFADCRVGLGAAALSSLLGRAGANPPGGGPGDPRAGHFAGKAKAVIHLCMNGAPSQLDLFDDKPVLRQYNLKECPEEFLRGERFAFIRGTPKLLGSPYAFARHGRGGAAMSELLPHMARVADDIAIVKSLQTDHINHAPAELFINTGFGRVGRPSLGSWVTYGLGSESSDLPGFVVLLSGGGQPSGGSSCWSSGFLPTSHQGVPFRAGSEAVCYVSDPAGVDRATRRRALDALSELNAMRQGVVRDPEIGTRISAFEMAYRMQSSVPELLDLAGEQQETLELYGVNPAQPSFARNCLMARRLVQRGVRFVQLYHRGWDSHGTSDGDDIVTSLKQRCLETDQACAALIEDLKRQGMLDSTLVIWGGEFGRTPMNEARNGSTFLGRDHHAKAFTMWLAGAGVQRGVTIGETDELGYNVTRDACHVHDLNATILHLLGFDHEKLTFRHEGRDYRLTDVHGKVFAPLLA